MTPSIKQINVGERIEFSHIEFRQNCAIIFFKETNEQLVILDEWFYKCLRVTKEVFEHEMRDKRNALHWVKVEITCYYHTPINTICLYRVGSPEAEEGRPMWVRGFDPYTAFVNIVFKSIRNKALLV